ncbi:nucleotide sugar dehydrogenase [Aeromicrobium sp. Leaf350]|uniref:nucleotide sugar dehydrogenase n=1 Tax=Aeromicrobium sp. Leaf350 TaxID=2876565 RepID=UPI001E41C252|nr:nucleotide sugar dehydrogenase [Aeromicrobium sp. Leaf350]
MSTAPVTGPQLEPAAHGRQPDLNIVDPSPATGFTRDVAVIGLGYVGLPTALAYFAADQAVLGLDASAARLVAIGAGQVDVIPTDRARLESAMFDDRFQLTADPAMLSTAAAVIVCVPTPVDSHFVPDLTALRAACDTAVRHATPGQVIVLTSTTYVGCTIDLLVEPLARRGLRAGEDVFVAFSAERIDPGNSGTAQEVLPRVIGGATPACAERAAATLAGYAEHVHQVPSLATAEMTKLLENTFRAVNIALVNEFADICRTLDIDVTHVIEAAATKPYGFMAFTPGPGVGGHCIPCDPHYLLWQLRKDRTDAPMITEAMRQIAGRPGRTVDRVREMLAERPMAVKGARVLVVGVAYKPDVADVRESPALEILQGLRDLGAAIGYVDPHVPEVRLRDGVVLKSLVDPRWFNPALVLLHTPHADTDLSWLTPGQPVLDATFGRLDVADAVAL